MTALKVCVRFRPHLYNEILKWLFHSLQQVEVIEVLQTEFSVNVTDCPWGNTVDVFILPVDDDGRPEVELLPDPTPPAKLVAVSPYGHLGLLRHPGQNHWEPVQPFGLAQLIAEVTSQSEQIVH
jgi:hypothetical protein